MAAREPAPSTAHCAWDIGRNLFAFSRAMVTPADQGALSISCGPPGATAALEYDQEYELGDDPQAAARPARIPRRLTPLQPAPRQ